MAERWILILEDGTRYPVTGNIEFKIIHGTKMLAGTLDFDLAVHRAFEQASAILEDESGQRHHFMVEKIQGEQATIIGVMRPD